MARPTAAIPVQIPIARALALGIGKRGADERERRDIDECGTDALEATRHNERLDARREPAGHRRQAEHHDADDVAEPAAVVIAEHRARHHEHRHGEAVRGNHPLHA